MDFFQKRKSESDKRGNGKKHRNAHRYIGKLKVFFDIDKEKQDER
jgi:hypothetical protein